jgi:hypothetical protein
VINVLAVSRRSFTRVWELSVEEVSVNMFSDFQLCIVCHSCLLTSTPFPLTVYFLITKTGNCRLQGLHSTFTFQSIQKRVTRVQLVHVVTFRLVLLQAGNRSSFQVLLVIGSSVIAGSSTRRLALLCCHPSPSVCLSVPPSLSCRGH